VGATVADAYLGSSASLYVFDASAAGYVPLPWANHTIAARVAGAVSAGAYADRRLFYVGGYDLEGTDLFDATLGGAFDGSFVLRGYPAGAYAGRAYLLQSLEYRAPLLVPNVGPSTLPVFLRRIDGAAFADWGGAFDRLAFERAAFARRGELVDVPGLHSSFGLELWLGMTVAYRLDASFKIGWARGVAPEALENGQLYFLGGGAF
jgi:outer membrane protein assembly factor BamA